jgi:hypothetical protein
MHLESQDYLFGTVSFVLLLLIAVVVFRREVFRQFAIFTSYTLFQLIATVVVYAELAHGISSLHYAYTYYPIAILGIALGFAVIYEVFRVVLEPYDALRRVWRMLFFGAGLMLFIAAILWVIYGSGPQADRLTESMNILQRTLTVVQAGLLLLLFVLSGSLGLSWRSYSFGLALGYGIFAIVELVLWSVRTHYGNQFWKPQSTLNSVAYNVMIAVWASYLLQPAKVLQQPRVIPYNDIAKWNEKLEELLKRKAA